MKKYIFVSLILLLIGTIPTACKHNPASSQEEVSTRFLRPPGFEPLSIRPVCFAEGSVVLNASRSSYNAGNLNYRVSIPNNTLTVTYVAADGVGIFETHLWVGTNLNNMPSAGRGQPVNGRFPYGDKFKSPVDSIAYVISLSDIENYTKTSPLFIVAHAVVQGSSQAEFSSKETAYAGDNKGNSPRWWWYIESNQREKCVRPSELY